MPLSSQNRAGFRSVQFGIIVSEQSIIPDFFPVVVSSTTPAAEGVQRFEFRDSDGKDLPEFTPGSHITVRVPNGELRKYSLCNDSGDRSYYEIAVKREMDGRGGSLSLIDGVKTGDRILIGRPENNFELKHNSAGYIFIAGGIGVTPLIAMMRYLKSHDGPKAKLYYLARSPETSAFIAELTGPEFRNQVVVHYDGGDPAKSLDLWPLLERPKGQHLYCCGPRGLMQAVRDMTGHWSSAAIHFESFTDAAHMERSNDRPFLVRLARSGEKVEIPIGKSILEMLRSRGHSLASSCESGTCGTCKTKYLAGDPDHRDLVLHETEKSDFVMICVSRANSDSLTLDL